MDFRYKAKVDNRWLKGRSLTDHKEDASEFETESEPTQIINQLKRDGKIAQKAKIKIVKRRESIEGGYKMNLRKIYESSSVGLTVEEVKSIILEFYNCEEPEIFINDEGYGESEPVFLAHMFMPGKRFLGAPDRHFDIQIFNEIFKEKIVMRADGTRAFCKFPLSGLTKDALIEFFQICRNVTKVGYELGFIYEIGNWNFDSYPISEEAQKNSDEVLSFIINIINMQRNYGANDAIDNEDEDEDEAWYSEEVTKEDVFQKVHEDQDMFGDIEHIDSVICGLQDAAWQEFEGYTREEFYDEYPNWIIAHDEPSDEDIEYYFEEYNDQYPGDRY